MYITGSKAESISTSLIVLQDTVELAIKIQIFLQKFQIMMLDKCRNNQIYYQLYVYVSI